MPITPVAGQTRSLDGHHGADAALADRRQQLLESRTSDTRARATEIVVDDADIDPTELSGALDESILPPAAFLTDRRLADIDDRLAGEMVSSDPVHLAPPCGSASKARSSTPPSEAPSESPPSLAAVRSGWAGDLAVLRT